MKIFIWFVGMYIVNDVIETERFSFQINFK